MHAGGAGNIADDVGEFEINLLENFLDMLNMWKRGSAGDWLCDEPYRAGHACSVLG